MQQEAVAGFHSHPVFLSDDEMNEGVTRNGGGPYSGGGAIVSYANTLNRTFQGAELGSEEGGDFDWPPDTGTPF